MAITFRSRFSPLDHAAFAILLLLCAFVGARVWLEEHPEHNPWAPLSLHDPPGWATARKLATLRGDPAECRRVLDRSAVAFAQLEPAGEGECRRVDRITLNETPLSPASPTATCAVSAMFERWRRQVVEPAALELLGAPVARIEHLGTYSCRRLYGRADGRWSEHAQGNALDIAAFVLSDGRRIAVLRDWNGKSEKAEFLRRVRDGACQSFSTVLSPDYNGAHADHLHFDQADRSFGGVCR